MSRPAKIQRLERQPSTSISPAQSPSTNPRQQFGDRGQDILSRAPRTRGVTACQTCRNRKTRCDNQRPVCGYCLRVNVQCVYLEDDPPNACNVYGAQILEAVQNLTSIVQVQQQQQQNFIASTLQSQNNQPAASPVANYLTPSSPRPSTDRPPPDERSGRRSITSRDHRYLPQKDSPAPLGLASVLQWSSLSDINFPDLFPDDEEPEDELSHAIPSLDYVELSRLVSKYSAGVHMYNPILDLSRVRRLVSQISENGLDWSASTCLVMLVCAVGAITELDSPDTDGPPKDETRLAMQYWSVAAKRIGCVMAQHSIESIQCLCLAGIWYMNNIRPLQAWKFFSLAGNAWYATTRRQPPSAALDDARERENTATLEQSLYFTIYKSECELRIDLNIPGSVLADISLPYAFPLPPHLDRQKPTSDSGITERGWYFYLADIAARHLINSLIRARSEFRLGSEPADIQRLLADVQIFETQLMKWHASLPPILSFLIPHGKLSGISDEPSLILRFRYLTISELLYRPFVQLCVENRLDLDPELSRSVTTMASRCLQACMHKLESISYRHPTRHQGTWLGLGSIATCIAVLAAANRARRDPQLFGAAGLIMPVGWYEQGLRIVELWGRFWNGKTGGTQRIKQVIDLISIDHSNYAKPYGIR